MNAYISQCCGIMGITFLVYTDFIHKSLIKHCKTTLFIFMLAVTFLKVNIGNFWQVALIPSKKNYICFLRINNYCP